MEPTVRARYLVYLLPYVLPRPNSVEPRSEQPRVQPKKNFLNWFIAAALQKKRCSILKLMPAMQFEKGRKKTGGRQRGSINKATTNMKSRIAALIDDQFETIQADLETLEPKERIAAYMKFMEYVLPKQREQKIDLSTLSDEQIDDLLDKALAKLD